MLNIWGKLSRRRRIQLALLIVVMLTTGAMELISLGAVVPFLAVLSDPERLWRQPLAQALAASAGLTSPSELIAPACAGFAAASISAALVRLLNLSLNCRMAAAIGSDLSGEAYLRTLYQPYQVHVQRNTSTVINTITTQVGRTVAAINSSLTLATSLLTSSLLIIGLLVLNWKVALAAAGLFSISYAIIGGLNRAKLNRNGRKLEEACSQELKAVHEGLGAIREVLLEGSQQHYLSIYLRADRCQRQLQAKNEFLVAYPRYVMEALGMASIALLSWVLAIQNGSSGEIIPLLGAIALGAQRLLPAMQTSYGSWASLQGFNADLLAVLNLLDQPIPRVLDKSLPMSLNDSIKLEVVDFRYTIEHPAVLQGLDIEIKKGERIGLIGNSGSGKSTTADIIMGLLKPTSGKILVDGLDIYDPAHPERLEEWRAAIGHVPQNIFLADSSIAENIAFGVPKEEIDMNRVVNAAEKAQIKSFIECSIGGYTSHPGERGIRLSGGQRQRLGIARALYKDAKVLVFDEATSSLDHETERAVIDSIDSLSKDLTVVMIAHRLSTLKNFDRIIKIVNGKPECHNIS